MTNARAAVAADRRRVMAQLHDRGLSTHAIARILGVDRRHVARTLRALTGRESRDDTEDRHPSRGPEDAASDRREQRRALLIEAGIAWLTMFGVLPNTRSWNATKAREDGPESFLYHEMAFISRLDGRAHPWPSPATIARHFRTAPSRGQLDEYREIVGQVHRELIRNGTPYEPIVLEDSLIWAMLQASSRASVADPKMQVPHQLRCRPGDSAMPGDEPRGRIGSSDWGPIRIPRLTDRGVCLVAALDPDRRVDVTRTVLRADLVDEELGVMILATPLSVTIRAREGRVPRMDRLDVPGATTSPAGILTIPEMPPAGGQRPWEARPGLLMALRWALDYQHDLAATGIVSILVAEAQADGRSVLLALAGVAQFWWTTNLALTAIIDPTGSPDEQLLSQIATTRVEFVQGHRIAPEDVFDPGCGISDATLRAIRSALRGARPEAET